MTAVPRELRALGVTTQEWLYEEIAEAIDATPGAFHASTLPQVPNHIRLVCQVLDDFVAAGLLRELDLRTGGMFVRTDLPCAMREPEMRIYRCFDSAGQLLYIGCTSKPVIVRCASHAQAKEWWPDVATITEQVVIGWQAGLNAERAAIQVELPLHNKANNPRRQRVAS